MCSLGLTFLDHLICVFIIFPLSVLHWRGTWQLQDEYFLPDNILSSSWISLTVGANVCVLELLLQPMLKDYLSEVDHVVYVIASRLHLYVHGWAVMCYWRGLWNLLDLYLTAFWVNSVIIYCICQLTMIIFQTVRTPVGVPIAIQLDTDPDLLEPDIVFKTSHHRLIPFVLDCLFTQFVIVSSSICIWRGIWNIADAFIFPHIKDHFEDRSDLISLLSGLFITVFFLSLQLPTSWLSARLDGHPWAKIAFEDVLFMILMWGNLLLWRGGWNLCIHHFLPKPHIGSWASHWIGTVGLMLLQVFNNVGLHGIVRDGSYERGEGIYATYYLRILCQVDTKLTAENPAVSHGKSNSDESISSEGNSTDDELSSLEELQQPLVRKPGIGHGDQPTKQEFDSENHHSLENNVVGDGSGDGGSCIANNVANGQHLLNKF